MNDRRASTPITNLKQTNPVDFLVVGAAKSGTTTLFETLSKHPGIYIPQRKECRYFSCMRGDFTGPGLIAANNFTQSLDEYQGLFEMAVPEQICGDVSPDYLFYHQKAVPKILEEKSAHVPIIIVLRNPIERAYSNYLMKVRDGREKLSFEHALDMEKQRRAANWAWGWYYVEIGLYAKQVKTYLDNFERVLLLLFEEDIVTGRATGKVLNFLNVDPRYELTDNIYTNASGFPKNRILHRLMTDELIIRKFKNFVKATPFYASSKQIYRKLMGANLNKIPMPAKSRKILAERFKDDVALLAEYTKLPVSKFWPDFKS